MIKVNEIFPTLQGEGWWTGTPSTFIRLQGCPVGCPWCDTKHTWPESERKRIDVEAMLNKNEDPHPTWAAMAAEHIAVTVREFVPRHFVITGGEPCAQDIYDLTVLLAREGRVQIETSGTYPVQAATDAWVTVSPKMGMPGGLEVLSQALERANEIKMPVEGCDDIKRLHQLLARLKHGRPMVCLQPVSCEPEATRLCIDECMRAGFQLSLQTHKLVGVR